MLDQSVLHGIPPAVPWNELVAKKKWTSAQLKKAQHVRGKLNVPRERFQNRLSRRIPLGWEIIPPMRPFQRFSGQSDAK
jgi:hypothetical protein